MGHLHDGIVGERGYKAGYPYLLLGLQAARGHPAARMLG
jgi:hypothetical protein